VKFGSADCALRCPAPNLGEHTREILCEIGLDESKIRDLVARRVAIEAPQS